MSRSAFERIGGSSAYLHAESVEELDRVRLYDGVDRPRRRLQIGKHMVREELDDVDEGVRRGDTLRVRRAASRDRREEEDGRVFRLPVRLRVGGVLLPAGFRRRGQHVLPRNTRHPNFLLTCK